MTRHYEFKNGQGVHSFLFCRCLLSRRFLCSQFFGGRWLGHFPVFVHFILRPA